MNIALVNPEYPSPSGLDQGGIATYTYSMAEALARLGHRIHVLVKIGTVPPALPSSVTVHDYAPVPPRDPFRRLLSLINGELYWERCFSIGVRKALIAISAAEPLDIVELSEYNGLAFALTPPLPFPIVIHFHTPSELVDFYNAVKVTARRGQWHAFEAKALSNATAFRSPSCALAKEMGARYSIPGRLIEFIPHPFDTAPFDTIEKKRDATVIDILFVGRLERRKGAEILRAAIQRILALDPRIRFTLAGELSAGDMGNFRGSIERTLSAPERQRVYFLGPVKRERLPVLYCRSHILCFPSLFENSPYTILEAIAAELPVVGARRGGIPEIIRHEETGLLFNPENPPELLECIRRLIENAGLAGALAKRAYAVVSKDFRPEKIATRTIAFYTKTIAEFVQDREPRPKSQA
jgi:glycosyltransferase involved in cell wall biosynthesis